MSREPYDAGEIKLVLGMVALWMLWILVVAVWRRWRPEHFIAEDRTHDE